MRTKAISVFLASAMFCFAVSASAVTTRNYIGSQCSFADNPLAGQTRIHHTFRNTSGVSQWITCPVAREGHHEVGWAGITASQVISYVRVEVRNVATGTFGYWNASGFSSVNGGPAVRYDWPSWLNAGAGDSFAFEANLPNGASIYQYTLTDV